MSIAWGFHEEFRYCGWASAGIQDSLSVCLKKKKKKLSTKATLENNYGKKWENARGFLQFAFVSHRERSIIIFILKIYGSWKIKLVN